MLCVETTAPNVEISDVQELAMVQGAFNTTPIVDGDPDALTQVTINNKEATIRYQIISAFFSDPFPDPIDAIGSILLAFTDDDGRRLLRSAKVVPAAARQLQDAEGFSVTMLAESAAEEDSSSAVGRSMVGVGIGAGMIGVVLLGTVASLVL